MKTFAAVFFGVLCAGVVLYGIYRYDQGEDRKAAAWELKAASLISDLKLAGPRAATGREQPVQRLEAILQEARSLRSTTPSRARRANFEAEVAVAELILSEAKAVIEPKKQRIRALMDRAMEAQGKAETLEMEIEALRLRQSQEITPAEIHGIVAEMYRKEESVGELRREARKLAAEAEQISRGL